MLSGLDIMRLIPQTNVLRYEDLEDYNTIESALGDNNSLVLLYPTMSNSIGHWCCLFINPRDQKLYFFDSYGIIPDDQLEFRTKEYLSRSEFNDGFDPDLYRYLTKLLYKTKREVDYNPYHFQSDDPDITTCGYWCVTRIIFNTLTADEFYNLFQPFTSHEITQDDLVLAFIQSYF